MRVRAPQWWQKMLLDMLEVRRHRPPKDYKLGLPFDRRLKRCYDGVGERASEKSTEGRAMHRANRSRINRLVLTGVSVGRL